MVLESVSGRYKSYLRLGAGRAPKAKYGQPQSHCLNWIVAFAGGCALGQLYYGYFLKKIPFPYRIGCILSLSISLLLGVGNLVCRQLRCICLLTLPMYCGKPGRAVLKAVVLTYVIAGPITNMGLNAKEVVRVFACSTELSYNLSRMRYSAVSTPFKTALFDIRSEVSQVKDTVRSFRDVENPIEFEIEGQNADYHHNYGHKNSNRTNRHENLQQLCCEQEEKDFYHSIYLQKIKSRCEKLISRATTFCMDVLTSKADGTDKETNQNSSWVLCRPMALDNICDLKKAVGSDICDSSKHINPGLGEGYAELKNATKMLTNNRDVLLQYKIQTFHELYDVQDAKETGDRVLHAFEQKYIIMHAVTIIVDICVALLSLRIFAAAVTYHDKYLTKIEHDNIYVTNYFKKIDKRRKNGYVYTLLPLKKMEKIKYTDLHSFRYELLDREKLVPHILKVTLEVVTATTFIMLDRLFYEALDVVRQHADTEIPVEGTRDLDIQVEGAGALAAIVRKLFASLNSPDISVRPVANKHCLPCPHLISPLFYFKIYGGYLWILFLLCINPYTMRLKRLICSYFYPHREKQRILHLYNDILKKRIKMHETLRRKAVQAVRVHYLSGENLLSLRMKFPRLLGWLNIFPAARMTCLICGETSPRNNNVPEESWHPCTISKCPFMYCVECWREVGASCLACDPSLADLSDVDSITEDELRE